MLISLTELRTKRARIARNKETIRIQGGSIANLEKMLADDTKQLEKYRKAVKDDEERLAAARLQYDAAVKYIAENDVDGESDKSEEIEKIAAKIAKLQALQKQLEKLS